MNDRVVIDALEALLGPDAVRTDDEARELTAGDLHVVGERPAAVVRPPDAAGVAAAVRAATSCGYAVVARGGGLSYTGGYAASTPRSICFDMRGLDRIVDISATDMTITVEAGVTWRQIDEALRPKGLRLPFIGTFSGAGATVGGGLGHGALFFGSARYGCAADIVLGIDVALADGTMLRTGQGALAVDSKPISRSFGPDLTGLFTHDGGMFGIKTAASFRLIRTPPETGYASFAFSTFEAASDALCEMARCELAEEIYILDPGTTQALASDNGAAVKAAATAVRRAGGAFKALTTLAELAKGGRDFIPDGHFSLHLTAAGRSAAAVRADLSEAHGVAARHAGRAIAPTLPRLARGNLFGDLNGVLGPAGGRWAALNAKVAHSEAQRLIEAFDGLVSRHRGAMASHGVTYRRLASALANHCFSFEPVFHWQDSWRPLHRTAPEPAFLAGVEEPEANMEGRALVDRLRQETVDLFRSLGAASNQIGRSYPFHQALSGAPRTLLSNIKMALDPRGLMNPGVLGFA